MTTTKIIYLTAVIVPGGFALLALAAALHLYWRRSRHPAQAVAR